MTAALIKIQTVDPVEVTTIGEWSLNATIQVPTPTFAERVIAIGSINVAIGVPTGATTVTITPPTTNNTALVLRGDPADIGVLLNASQPTQLCLDVSQTTLNLSCAASIYVTFTFI